MSSPPSSPPSEKRARIAVPSPERLAAIAEAVTQGDLAPALGLVPNSRFEVLWCVDDDNTWWKATLLGKTVRTHQLEAAESDDEDFAGILPVPVYEIRYDARDDFPPSRASVCFLDEHRVLDLTADETMAFRLEGATWEPEEDEEGEDVEIAQDPSATAAEGKEEARSDHPVLRAVEDLLRQRERQRIDSLQDDDSAVLEPMSAEQSSQESERYVDAVLGDLAKKHEELVKRLPAGAQFQLIDRLKTLRSGLITGVAQVLTTKGHITPEDAQGIIENIKRESQ